MDEFSVALFFSTKYSDIKARWFVHSSTNAIIVLIEVKGRSVGHKDAKEKENLLLQNQSLNQFQWKNIVLSREGGTLTKSEKEHWTWY